MDTTHLPIYKATLDYCVYIEVIVKGFDKYHKYTLGNDLRNHSKALLFLLHHANRVNNKKEELKQLLRQCEENKMMLQLSKELKVFKSFKQFEHASKLAINICRQAQAWYNHFARVSK
jgi:hypothetical protein